MLVVECRAAARAAEERIVTMKNTGFVWLVSALLALPAGGAAADAAEGAFALGDIHFWAGDGASRAGVVVDFSREGARPLVWGFRWDGEKTLADALRAIVAEDPRLHALVGETQYGDALYALGYDVADGAAAFRLDCNRGDVEAESSDPAALAEGGWNSGYWRQWTAPADEAFDASALGSGLGLSATALSNASWHVLQFQRPEWGWDARPLSGVPAAAESPYGWRVVAADVAAGGDYGDVTNALGHPSRTVPGWGSIPPTTVNPASPAWGPGRLVTLEADSDPDAAGSITIEFDHDVVDDDRNPFGLDFLVFGNALHQIGGNAYFDGVSDPAEFRFGTATMAAEPGLVEVSADGKTWFAFADGPYADDFAPTMAFRYDPENADASLFEGNAWWGAPADATRPVDPELSAADFKGRTLAEYATLYDGSAGGTGFDISAFDLPRDAQGRKYIRFVRIATLDPGSGDFTEVDAVADVAPAPSFRNWVDARFGFEARPGVAKTDVNAAGVPYAALAAFGLPEDAAALPAGWGVGAFDPAARSFRAAVPFAPYAWDLVTLRSSPSLSEAPETWKATLPVWDGADAAGRQLLLAAPSAAPGGSAGFFRLDLE